jgi:RNA ligase (TIGR02306 family)
MKGKSSFKLPKKQPIRNSEIEMSTIRITIETIDSIHAHPNADRLEIAHILGTQTIVGKGEFQPGDQVVFFPPDILLPPDVAADLGVQKYLKHALWEDANGDIQKSQCRVAACRLRGIPSYGFVAPVPELPPFFETDLTDYYQAVKYEPPVKLTMAGDVMAEPSNFQRYTSIEHYYRYPHVLEPGTMVRVMEKIHGTNCRLGSLDIEGLNGFICGSHRTAQKMRDARGKPSLYWEPLNSDPKVQTALQELNKHGDTIIYGEIYGPGVQDMDYGVKPGKIGFRVFDISINGRYMNWDQLHTTCVGYGLQLMPLIYLGPFDPDLIEEWTNGPTLMVESDQVKAKFKGREGCVITPLTEIYHPDVGRVVLKSVSADYLDRKGAKDNG